MSELEWIRVEGASMRPFLHSGDWIAVKWRVVAASPISLRVGELVLGREEGGEWIVHRITGHTATRAVPERFILKGDAAFAAESLAPEQIWGRVAAIRFVRTGQVATFRASWLDGLIAVVSMQALPPERWVAKFARRATFVLAAARRRLLWPYELT